MSFHDTELNVIRWAEANGKLTECSADYKALKTVQTVGDLCFAIAAGEKVEISDAMGRVAIDLIVLSSMVDIDLAKSLETAFNKISAKPVDTSNVVLLKRE